MAPHLGPTPANRPPGLGEGILFSADDQQGRDGHHHEAAGRARRRVASRDRTFMVQPPIPTCASADPTPRGPSYRPRFSFLL